MDKMVLPGSFDPLTHGHLDLIERGVVLCRRLTIVVAQNTTKQCLFSLQQRCDFVREAVMRMANVVVDTWDGLLVEYCKQKDIRLLLRGIRSFSDYEYECNMSRLNREMCPDLETVFLVSRPHLAHINANMVKEFARFGGDVRAWVPPYVGEALSAHVQRKV